MRRFAIGGLIVVGLMLAVPGFAAPSVARTASQASQGGVDVGNATATPCASPTAGSIDPGFTAKLPPSKAGDPGFLVRPAPGVAIDPGFSPSSASPCQSSHLVVGALP